MRRSVVGFVLALAEGRLAQKSCARAEDWKPLSAAAASSAIAPEAYYPPEELERLRRNMQRAIEHAAAYIAAELEKAKGRRERRSGRQ
jgi:hypothetical protein